MRHLIGSLCVLAACAVPLRAAETSYHLIREIRIGTAGGWDYISVDPKARRVYVSHSTRVVVIDPDAGTVVGEIPDLPGVHGLAVASDLGRGFSSNGRENASTVVDLKALAVVAKVPTGGNPDAILYEPGRKEVYTFNGSGKSATVIDAAGAKVVATIPLGGKPEAAVADPAIHRVYVNVEDTASLVAIDTTTHAVAATWPIAGCEEPTGLAYAAAQHRLFSACRNKVLVMTDSESGHQVGHVAIGDRVDGAAYDADTRLVFASNGEGTVTIAHLDGPDRLTVVQTLQTAPSARTMALDPTTHVIYLPAADSAPPTTPGGRPQPVAESFRVLVYGQQ